MNTKFSLSEFASNHSRQAFLCNCKTCGMKMTEYVPISTWLDIVYVLVEGDLVTQAEFKKLNHLAVSQWATIKETLGQVA